MLKLAGLRTVVIGCSGYHFSNFGSKKKKKQLQFISTKYPFKFEFKHVFNP